MNIYKFEALLTAVVAAANELCILCMGLVFGEL